MLRKTTRRVVSQQTTLQPNAVSIDHVAPQTVSAAATRHRVNRQQARSADLVRAISRIDTVTDPTTYQQLLDWIKDEYDSRQTGIPIGMFAKCYLGPPYIDHQLMLTGTICEHYPPSKEPPAPYDTARGLVRSGAYEFIEFYSDGSMVAVRSDGGTVEVQAGVAAALGPSDHLAAERRPR